MDTIEHLANMAIDDIGYILRSDKVITYQEYQDIIRNLASRKEPMHLNVIADIFAIMIQVYDYDYLTNDFIYEELHDIIRKVDSKRTISNICRGYAYCVARELADLVESDKNNDTASLKTIEVIRDIYLFLERLQKKYDIWQTDIEFHTIETWCLGVFAKNIPCIRNERVALITLSSSQI